MLENKQLEKRKVAVELAVYNGIKWLPYQLNSILKQEDVDITIFLSVDPSSDGSEDFCRQYSEKEKRVKVLPLIGKFGGAAKNFFRLIRDVEITNFDYIAFSDQDDIWNSKKIIHAIRCLQANNCEGYSSNLIAFDDEKKKKWILRKNAPQKKADYLFQGASAGCTYVLSNKAMSIVKEKIGLDHSKFPNGFSHDWLIYAICRSYHILWFFDENALIKYRQHDNNVYGALPGIVGFIKRYQSVNNGWYKKHILWLNNFIKNDTYEEKVLNSINKFGFYDRCWLLLNVFNFRRNSKDCLLLAIAILLKKI